MEKKRVYVGGVKDIEIYLRIHSAVHATFTTSVHYKLCISFCILFFYYSSVFNITFNADSCSGTSAASLEQQTSRESDFCPAYNDSHHSTCTLYGLCLHPGSMSGLQGGAATHRKRRSLGQAQQTQCRGPVARKQRPYIMPKAICQPECLIWGSSTVICRRRRPWRDKLVTQTFHKCKALGS